MSDVDVEVFETDAPLEVLFDIRERVFVDEQGVPAEAEMDGRDDDAVQFLARLDGDPVGTARLRGIGDGICKIERVAVLEPYRERGVGRALMTVSERVAHEHGFDRVELTAQVAVEEFYHDLDYETTSDVFDEVGIPHVYMEKAL